MRPKNSPWNSKLNFCKRPGLFIFFFNSTVRLIYLSFQAYGHEALNNYIPELKFKYLTLTIVSISLMIGIAIPNIEFVLGLVGSTIGVMICLIFPMAFFISITTKNTNERVLAQVILAVGVLIMVCGTYANLYAMEQSTSSPLSVASSDKSFRDPVINENLQMPSDLKNLNVLERIEGKRKWIFFL